jgi:hypothetical protein
LVKAVNMKLVLCIFEQQYGLKKISQKWKFLFRKS